MENARIHVAGDSEHWVQNEHADNFNWLRSNFLVAPSDGRCRALPRPTAQRDVRGRRRWDAPISR